MFAVTCWCQISKMENQREILIHLEFSRTRKKKQKKGKKCEAKAISSADV